MKVRSLRPACDPSPNGFRSTPDRIFHTAGDINKLQIVAPTAKSSALQPNSMTNRCRSNHGSPDAEPSIEDIEHSVPGQTGQQKSGALCPKPNCRWFLRPHLSRGTAVGTRRRGHLQPLHVRCYGHERFSGTWSRPVLSQCWVARCEQKKWTLQEVVKVRERKGGQH